MADLIVIGNVGRSGISKIRMLGSVSRRVGERAPCPVMIIH
jgi:nucleotide-binding universal stress UspA family protein